MLPMAFSADNGSGEIVTGVPESDLRLEPPRGEGNANPGFWGVLVATVVEVVQVIGRGLERLFGR